MIGATASQAFSQKITTRFCRKSPPTLSSLPFVFCGIVPGADQPAVVAVLIGAKDGMTRW